ncbi:MAG: alpha-amylase family glycosyl hydrolase [Candidatus Pseudobacter hemicellulosilyticus]|uniref:Alpha-amylase family glycosyl hydrolase n=1 Tax=Candidatus Pseudobacter hemicellulosilyticus TaxID=3121375 RepID=A0AAJ5WTU8_9BACT|nr:MAG: alpha-amylase family glycosyl hydrolase [Pseudobacter sp.]
MRTIMWTILLSWLLLGCSKDSPAPFEPPVDNGPEQYGTPFARVPDPEDASIYQVNLRAFSKEANFKGVQDRLDAIRALGVNVLYLMPVFPVGTVNSVNSPYCVKDYRSVNPEFGNLDGLRSLVAAAHDRGMSVIMDWVANHTAWDHPWTSNKSWYQQDAGGKIISPPGTGWNDVAQLNFNNADMRLAMISAMKYWVYTANIDGYRCDAADFVPAGFWKQAIDSLRAIRTHKLLLFAEGSRKDHFSSGFQLMYGMGFYYNLVNNVYGKDGPVSTIDSVNRVEYSNATASSRIVRYISNHDVNNSDGTPLELLGGQEGSVAAFVVSAYLNSVPMIYNGQEVGCPVRLNYFNSSTQVDWDLHPELKAEYKKIMDLRNNSLALRRGTLTIYPQPDVAVFLRKQEAEQVLVMVNLRRHAATAEIPAALAGSQWRLAFGGAAAMLPQQVSLPAYGYQVWKKE